MNAALKIGLCLLAGCSASPRRAWTTLTIDDQPKLTYPIAIKNGLLAIQVGVNGGGPYRFNLDTGASIAACVDEGLARELALPVVGRTRNSDGHKVVERDLVRVDALTLGAWSWNSVTALADDYAWIDPSDPVRGLLGFPLFDGKLLTIDYPNEELVVESGRLDPQEAHVVRCARGSRPTVTVTIGDAQHEVLVDTGGNCSLILPADALAATRLQGEPQRSQSRGVYGVVETLTGVAAESVELAGHRFDDVPITFSGEMALVGRGLLSEFAVRFDTRNGLMQLAPSVPKPAPAGPTNENDSVGAL